MPGNCSPYIVHGIHSSIVTPPTGAVHVCQVQREENQQCGYDEAAVQRCRGDVVVLQPPASVSPSDEIVEDNAADTPAEVDVDSRRGKQANASKDDWRADIAPERSGPATRQKPSGNGRNGTDKPKPLQGRIESSMAEDSGRANGAPDD